MTDPRDTILEILAGVDGDDDDWEIEEGIAISVGSL